MDRVAAKVLRESLCARAGQSVTIETWNTGLAFAQRATVQARRIGAVPLLLFEDEESFAEGLRRTPREHLGEMGKHEYALLSKTDAYIFIPGPALGGSPRLSREQVTKSTAYNASWYGVAKKSRVRAARMTFGYVGTELAKVLRKPLPEVVEHQLSASLTDFREVRRRGHELSRLLKPGKSATLRAEGDSLRFELGQDSALDDGVVVGKDLVDGGNMTNVPPGYFAREVVGGTLSGAVRLYAPVPRLGVVAHLRMAFSAGKLVAWECDEDQAWLDHLVRDTPRDRRTLSALVVGLNPSLRYGYGQDRLVVGAVTFFGMFQGTTRTATLEADGRTLIEGRVQAL